MNQYRVDKREQPATLFLADGVVQEGVLFLSPFSQSHSGEQSLLELLRDREVFIPFRRHDGGFCLINKDSITHLRYNPISEFIPPFGDRVMVRITFFGGELLQGSIALDMPEGQNRLQDYLNAAPGFFPLDSGDAHYIVNGALIRDITPLR